jgi:hypothetical protein
MRLTVAQTREQMAELEEAIGRIEADTRQEDERRRLARLLQITDQTPTPVEAIDGFDSDQLSLGTGQEVVVSSSRLGGVQEIYAPAHQVAMRTLRRIAPAQQDAPADEQQSSWRKGLRTSAIGIAQLTLAAFIAVALYAGIAGRQRNSPQPPANVPAAGRPVPDLTNADLGSAAAAAGAPATAGERSAVLPTMYGVYAIRGNRLVELEQIPTGPVDPRLRQMLQTTKPSRTSFADGKLAFMVFRRDLLTSAPEKVSIRILAKIARVTTFDAGKAVTVPPPTDTWLIRETGYDFRVLPVRESQEMILIRPQDSAFSFPPGRYALMLSGQPYEFSVEGSPTDPAQCVESFATARGPAFNECPAPN